MNFIKQNDSWITKAQEVFDIQQKIKFLEAQEKRLATELKALSNHTSSVGGGYVYENSFRPGTIDYKAIPELRDINLEQYRKAEISYWKLTFVGSLTEEMK